MKLFNIFAKKAPNRVFISIVVGVLAGICYSALIPLVLSSVGSEDPSFPNSAEQIETILFIEVTNYKMALLFFATCILIFLMRSVSEIMLVRVAIEVAKDLRTKFYQQIFDASLEVVEDIGSSKLIASINIDIPKIIAGARVLPSLIINGITLVGMLAFLMYLNSDVFFLVILAIVVGVVCYQIPMMIGRKIFHRSREIQDQLQESIKGLIYGAKELKLDSFKRQSYFNDVLIDREQKILVNDKKAHTMVRATMSFGDLISFFVIGSISFIFINYYSISAEELLGVVMALLYVTGPIAVLLNAIPMLAIASVSYRKLNRLLEEIPKENVSSELVDISGWKSLKFEQVEYSYPAVANEQGFHIGPIDLEIKKGEINFIVGANGSGKSTLSKLLTLHYKPSSGKVQFGVCEVNQATISSCRQNIGAIYSDYYLFDRLMIELTEDVTLIAQRYLEKFHLAEKVKIQSGKFSRLSLSDGQRKRLALLVSFLEDKQLYLFDEWAADQDPVFKKVFYTEILPELKARGKAVIVISHDDHYFDIADHVLVIEQGKLVNHKSSSPVVLDAELTV